MSAERNIWHPHANAVEWIEAGGEVQRRDGVKVRVLATDFPGVFPLLAAFLCGDKPNGDAIRFAINGRQGPYGSVSPGDLVPAPRRHVGWVNAYRALDTRSGEAGAFWLSPVYNSPASARANAAPGCIRCLRIDFAEGEGLE